MVVKNQLETELAEQLFKAVVSLRSTTECRAFMRDLCTLSELEAMAERFQVAKLLRAGHSYRQINEQTGSSTATITRVAHWFKHGTGGYEQILDRID